MSRHLSESSLSDQEKYSPLRHGHDTDSHRHSQNRSADLVGSSGTIAMADIEEVTPEVEISAGQKMLSAVSGSLLTSFLGG